jgi:hypothetical protein
MNEEWRDIPGWPGYQASCLGKIKRLACVGGAGRKLRERILKQTNTRIGRQYIYVSVGLGNAEHNERLSVARLVLLSFVGSPGPGEECRHLDDVSTNCVLSNLAWGTRQQNRDDAVRNNRVARGEGNGAAKLDQAAVLYIRSNYKASSRCVGYKALARKYGVHNTTIMDIVHNRTWKTV